MWLFLAFLAIPIIEIALFVQVGGAIGLGYTLAIVVLTAVLGTWLVRTQGLMALKNLQGSFSELRDPTEPLAHGAMILVSGALLLTPGFFTDAFGFTLLIPGVRSAAYQYLRARVQVQGFSMGRNIGGQNMGGQNRGQHPNMHQNPHAPQGANVIDGEYTEVDPTKTPTHAPSEWTKH